VSDITYISLDVGCCYLHLITDAYSHKIIGWKLADTLKAAITLDALSDAINQTGKEDLSGLIHHSDRGSQYLCIRYSERLAEAGIEPSVGSKGDSYDNALAETINGLYKAEVIHRRRAGHAGMGLLVQPPSVDGATW
jgi:transposase InsO family protein